MVCVRFRQRRDGGDSGGDPAHARLQQRTCPIQFDQEDFVDLFLPVLLCPPAQTVPRQQARLVIVGAEVGRARVRNIDRDERDLGLHVFRGDGWRDHFIGLKLDDQIQLLPDQIIRAAQSDFRLITIVRHDQLDVFPLGRPRQPDPHLPVE